MHTTLLAGLNPRQQQAVTLPHQSALILAGAGSGKTRVLTTRIAYLVNTGAVSPQGILAVTFTNKAARELLTRLSVMLPSATPAAHPRSMWVGTFHGLCNRLLRLHYPDANLPHTFQILDSAEQLSAIKRVMKGLEIDIDKYPPREIQNFISNSKEQGLRAFDVEAFDTYTRRKVEVYAAYDAQCQREGVVDFPELLLRCYELLSRNAALREHYQQRFAHILVDEFQDTNPLQYKWLKLLAGERNALFAVGDDDQSIYAFRGANVGNMKELLIDFKIPSVIKLEQNYRSHGNILDAANALISGNRNRLGKQLWTSEIAGEPLQVMEALTDVDEANFIVREVRRLHLQGLQFAQMALLYRSNAQSRVLEHALVSAGISYRVYGGLRFFERQEIKHALAYLRLMHNSADDNALLRIINYPTRGIGARSIEQLQEVAKALDCTLWEAANQNTAEGRQPGKGIVSFIALINGLRIRCDSLPLPQIIEQVLEYSGLIAHYRNETGTKKTEAQERLENLNELVTAATLFVHENEDDSLISFLAHASLEAGEHQAGDGDDALHLMTVHAAKGLEFNAVFITGLEEDLFPHQNSQRVDGGLDEERRLMYVAITRAKRHLYLSYAQKRMLNGQVNYGKQSSFLQELPASLLHWLSPRQVIRNPFASFGYASSAKTPVAASIDPVLWSVGQRVMHQKFGEGVITGLDGSGNQGRVQINFKHAGSKWLSLEYAKLQAL
jgi:DNA helicase-2/ATP-dependent DNA helicase PcrA